MIPAHSSTGSIERLLEATRSMDAGGLRAELREQGQRQGTESTVTDVVLPFLNAVGRAWESSGLTVAQEHVASQAVRAHLASDALVGAPDVSRISAPIVLACPPGERHDLGLLCFHVLLTRSGVPTRFLGSDTPLKGLVDVCRLVNASGVVIAATRSRAFEGLEGALRVLAARQPLGIGGAGASPSLAERIGARALPHDMAQAVRDVRDWHASALTVA